MLGMKVQLQALEQEEANSGIGSKLKTLAWNPITKTILGVGLGFAGGAWAAGGNELFQNLDLNPANASPWLTHLGTGVLTAGGALGGAYLFSKEGGAMDRGKQIAKLKEKIKEKEIELDEYEADKKAVKKAAKNSSGGGGGGGGGGTL